MRDAPWSRYLHLDLGWWEILLWMISGWERGGRALTRVWMMDGSGGGTMVSVLRSWEREWGKELGMLDRLDEFSL